MQKVRDAYQAMGGVVEVIVKPDCGHHPHSLEDPTPVVDFIKAHTDSYTDEQRINIRGNLDNSLEAMTVRQKATVAFLGGSITEMEGWKEMRACMEDAGCPVETVGKAERYYEAGAVGDLIRCLRSCRCG